MFDQAMMRSSSCSTRGKKVNLIGAASSPWPPGKFRAGQVFTRIDSMAQWVEQGHAPDRVIASDG
jgi:hypothetical protein